MTISTANTIILFQMVTLYLDSFSIFFKCFRGAIVIVKLFSLALFKLNLILLFSKKKINLKYLSNGIKTAHLVVFFLVYF